MTRIISGITAVICVALVASTINATRIVKLPGVTLFDHIAFFLAVCIALGLGALVFEVGKQIGPQEERRS